MNPLIIGLFVFGMTFGGVLGGIWLQRLLPKHHLNNDSQATVNVAIGLLATMTALILGLVTASAKDSFDTLDAAVKESAVEVLTLDRMLVRYGPESESARDALRTSLLNGRKTAWAEGSQDTPATPTVNAPAGPESVVKRIRRLPAQDEEQRWLKSRALELGERLLAARWVMVSSIGSSVPVPFLVVLVFWLTVIFSSFGLFAPRNATVISLLFVCALSVASAIFLILEMDEPFHGVIRISPEPLDFALTHMDR